MTSNELGLLRKRETDAQMWREGRLIFLISMHKFRTVNQQLSILKERGMHFEDQIKAKEILEDINYYNLINGNKRFFIVDSPNERYIEGIYFEEILSIYHLEAKLKELVLKNILLIEERLKRHLAYEFAKEYGCYSWDDINSYSHFSDQEIKYSNSFINKLNELLNTKNNDSRDKLIEHFHNQDEQIPIWAFVNLFNFGLTKYFFIDLNEKMKTKISQHFSLSPKQLKSFLETLNMFRNVCAHNNKLFFYKIYDNNKKITDMPVHHLLNLKTKDGKFIIGKNDLFAVVIIFKYMLKNSEFLRFYKEINYLLDEVTKKCEIITYKSICESIGFPIADGDQKSWKDIKNI